MTKLFREVWGRLKPQWVQGKTERESVQENEAPRKLVDFR